MTKIVIIGSQAAGLTFASKLKREHPNANIKIYEELKWCSFGACGMPYFIGNFFKDPNLMFSRTGEEIKNQGIDINFEHKVLKVHHMNKTIEVCNLKTNQIFTDHFDKLIIATGASSINPFINQKKQNIFNLKVLEDAIAIKNKANNSDCKNVAILGAGFIGMEMLEALLEYNHIENIYLFDQKPKITSSLIDDEFEELLLQEIKKHPKIKMLLSQKIEHVNEDNGKTTIKTNKTTIKDIDLTIVCLGFKPNTEFLNNLDLKTLPNKAIVIDKFGQTNLKDIYAVGDCATCYHQILEKDVYIPLATVANKMARKIAESMACDLAGKTYNDNFLGFLGSACLKMMNLEIAKTGITESEAIKNNIAFKSFFIKDSTHTHYYPGQSKIFMKILIDPNTQEIIGAQAVGEKYAMLKINALAIGISKKMTASELGFTDFAYSPPLNRTWDILNVIGSVAKKTT